MMPSRQPSVTLDPETIDAIAERAAQRTVELLTGPSHDGHARATPAAASIWKPPLADAREVAHALDVDLKTVYRHADKLGAVRVGRRLRFDLDRALRSWSCGADDRCPSERSQALQTPAPQRTSDTGQRPIDTAHCRLLPVGRRTGEL
jgi:hypothetical protein